jgi:hypothetical protein
MSRRLLTCVAIAVSVWAGAATGPAFAESNDLNEFCKDPAVQQTVAQALGVQANHGQCVKAFREGLLNPICETPEGQALVASMTGAKANFGQCKKALANLAFP